MENGSPLSQMASTIMARRIELEEKGYGPDLAEAAVKRAYKKAATMVGCLPKDMQERALAAFVDEELTYVERWMDGMKDSFEATGPPEPEGPPVEE